MVDANRGSRSIHPTDGFVTSATSSTKMQSEPLSVDASSPVTVASTLYSVSGTIVGGPNLSNVSESTTMVSEDVYLSQLNKQFASIVFPVVVVLGILMVVGAAGNAAVLYVYTCRARRKGQHGGTVTRFIQALALVDLLSCCIAIPGEILDITNNFTFGGNPLCKLVRTVSLFCTLTSGMTLIVVAIDRYKRICAPLKRQISPRGAGIILGVTSIVALFFSSPSLAVFGAKTVYTEIPSITGADCTISDELSGTLIPLLYSGIQMLLFVIGFFILLILYILIARRIFHHAHQRLQRRQSIVLGNRHLLPSTPSDVAGSSSSPSSVMTPLTPPLATQQTQQKARVKQTTKESRVSTKSPLSKGSYQLELRNLQAAEQPVEVKEAALVNNRLTVLPDDTQNKMSDKSERNTNKVSGDSFQPLSTPLVANNGPEVSYGRCSRSFTNSILDTDYRDGDSGFSTDSSPVCPKVTTTKQLLCQAELNGDIVDFSQTMPDSWTTKVENEDNNEKSTMEKSSPQMNPAYNLNKRGSLSLPVIPNTDSLTSSDQCTVSDNKNICRHSPSSNRATVLPNLFGLVSANNINGYSPLHDGNEDKSGHVISKESASYFGKVSPTDPPLEGNGHPKCNKKHSNKLVEADHVRVENTTPAPPKSLGVARRSLKEKLATSTHNLLGKLLSSESTGSEWDATLEISLSTPDHEMEVLSIQPERPRSSKRKKSKAEDHQVTQGEAESRKIDLRNVTLHDASRPRGETATRVSSSKKEEAVDLLSQQNGENKSDLSDRILNACSAETPKNLSQIHSTKAANKTEKEVQIQTPELDTKTSIKNAEVSNRRHSFSGVQYAEGNNETFHSGNAVKVETVQCASVTTKEGSNAANKKVGFIRRKSSSFNTADIKGWPLWRNDDELCTVQYKQRRTEDGPEFLSHKPRVSLRERRRGSSFKAIKEISLRRLSIRNDNAGTRRTTLILFLISLVYIISFLPHLAMMLVKSLHPEALSGDGQAWTVASNLIIRSYFINSVANPFIYTFLSKGFARRLRASLVRRWRHGSTRV